MSAFLVVGGGFAGMSAAARLAKLRHSVTLIEAGPALGGRLLQMPEGPWYMHPPTVTLPGVLRDLFRKSGRPLDRELSMRAEPGRRHVWADGTFLDLAMGNRADQFASVAHAMDTDQARDWSTWVDSWADTWDVLRRTGLDRLLASHRDFPAAQWRRLRPRRSLRRAARTGPVDRRFTDLITADARLAGHDIRRLPALWAVRHYVERSFGRWSFDGGPETLAAALRSRLQQRGVDVRLNTRAVALYEGPRVDVDGDHDGIEADQLVWCAGPPPGHSTRRLPSVPAARTLIGLTEPAGLTDHTGRTVSDIMMHADPPLRMWSVDQVHWTIAHHNAVDPVAVLDSSVLDLSGRITERHDVPARRLVTRAHFGWQIDSLRQGLTPQHRGRHPGMWQAGSHGSLDPGIEAIGMTTAAIADAVGPIPRT